jgi:hypothetical protein
VVAASAIRIGIREHALLVGRIDPGADDHLRAYASVAATPQVRNVIVCTLLQLVPTRRNLPIVLKLARLHDAERLPRNLEARSSNRMYSRPRRENELRSAAGEFYDRDRVSYRRFV